MRRPLRILAALLLALPLLASSATRARADSTSELLVNPGAETLDFTGWTDVLGNGFMIIQGVAQSGQAAFMGGVNGAPGPRTNELAQTATLGAVAIREIDAGRATSAFVAHAMSSQSGASIDDARVVLEFRDAADGVLATYDSGPVRPVNEWVRLTDERVVPIGTRALRVRLIGTRALSITTDALFDSLSLVLSGLTLDAATATPRATALQLRVRSNPMRGSGAIEVAVAEAGRLDVRIVDATGALVRVLSAGDSPAGTRTLRWDGRRGDGTLAAPGVYLVRANGAGVHANARVVLVR